MHVPFPERYTFPKSERLISKKTIEQLFKQGKSTFIYPFKILYIPLDQPAKVCPQILISVSRRNFKHAVDRNLIKRRIREVHRLHKKSLCDSEGHYKIMCLGIVYVAKEKIPFEILEEKLVAIFKRLRK